MLSGTIRIPAIRSVLAAAVTAAALTACGSSGGSTAPKTGSLAVILTGPAGSVTVTGPNGYTNTLSTTTLLTGLAVGSYTVTAAPVVSSGAIVGTYDTATVSGSPAAVTGGGQDTVTAAYAARPGSGGLWIANRNTATLIEYTASQLATGTSNAAATAVGTTTGSWGVAFDPNGNLWVSSFTYDTLMEFTASQLGASGTPTPTVKIATASNAAPGGIAFDSQGNMWVANLNAPSVVEYSASQLGSSGTPTPAIVIGSSGAMSQPDGLAFDAHGNLWVSNSAGNTIMEYTASQLQASGSPAPAVILTASSASISGPIFIAFDAAGDLWVANGDAGHNTVVEFTPSQLAATGSPTPTVTLSATSSSLDYPMGLAFDASGNLWVSNYSNSTIVEFTSSQIVTSGSPAPSVTISGTSLQVPVGIAFNPHATNLPIMPAKRK